jgi:anti-anti-sigma factor
MTRALHDDVPVLTVEGEVDAANAPNLSSELQAMLSNASFAIVADIAGVTYFDSAGLNALAVVHNELERRQQYLHVVAPPGSRARRLIDITRLDHVLTLHEDLTAALAAARSHT